MKTCKNSNQNSEVKGEEKASATNADPTVMEPKSVCEFMGLIQENYVNPKYLGVGIANSTTNMRFEGLWM